MDIIDQLFGSSSEDDEAAPDEQASAAAVPMTCTVSDSISGLSLVQGFLNVEQQVRYPGSANYMRGIGRTICGSMHTARQRRGFA